MMIWAICMVVVGGIGIVMCIHAMDCHQRITNLIAELGRRAKDIDTLNETVRVQQQTIDIQKHHIAKLKSELMRLRHYGWS